jgi:hypothetical protein
MRKIDHTPKYTRRLCNTLKHLKNVSGIRRVMCMNKRYNTFEVFTKRAFFNAITRLSK